MLVWTNIFYWCIHGALCKHRKIEIGKTFPCQHIWSLGSLYFYFINLFILNLYCISSPGFTTLFWSFLVRRYWASQIHCLSHFFFFQVFFSNYRQGRCKFLYIGMIFKNWIWINICLNAYYVQGIVESS